MTYGQEGRGSVETQHVTSEGLEREWTARGNINRLRWAQGCERSVKIDQ